jgi:phage portal protein BeeE
MRFLPALRRDAEPEQNRDQIEYALDEWIAYVNELIYNGNVYLTQGVNQTMPGQRQEPIGPAYRSFTDLAFKNDSVIFSLIATRMMSFSEARFQFSQMNNGRRGKLFGTQDLQILEEPWLGGTTGDLLSKMLMHADLGGNAFVAKRDDGTLAMLRPDWVTIVIGSNIDPMLGAWATDADVLGYIYSPGGFGSDAYETEKYLPEDVAHFAPMPDPEARFRGMSWLTPLIREVMADKAGVVHKLSFLENPTPNMVVKFDVPGLDEFKEQINEFKKAHTGARNAYKFMFGTTGMDFTPVGSNMKDLDYKLITGAGETRMCMAARVPAVIAGSSEGLQGSSLNSGNYQAARRQFADQTLRPLWRNAAATLATIVNVPGGAELWYDERDIAFLREDATERADVELKKAQTMRYLVDSGFEPDTVVEAVVSEDMSLLEHSGLYSVQLQPANAPKQGLFTGAPIPTQNVPTETPGAAAAAISAAGGNGNGNGNAGRSFYEDYPQYAPETHIHIEEGAIQMPASPDVHIHEGAIQNDIRTPDVHVDAPVTIEDGAVRVDAPPMPDVNVEGPRFEEGAITVEAPPPAEVNVTVEPSEPARVEIDLEPVQHGLRALADAQMDRERADAQPPIVNVTTPPAEVTVNVPEQPTPVVNVNIEDEPLDATVKFKRRTDGTIDSAEITEKPETDG